MSIFIKKSKLRVKNEGGTSYTGVMNAIAEESTEDLVKQIEAKGNKTLESIPEDYTVLEGNVDKLKEDLVELQIGAVGYVTPESFGAVGDGVTDDAKALQDAIDFAIEIKKELKPVSSDKIYLVTKKLVVNDTIKMDFSGACIKTNHNDYVVEVYVMSDGNTGIDGYIRNIVIDCNNLSDSGLWIRSSHRWNYSNITIKNAVSIALYTNACQDCRFNNIYIFDTADRGIRVDGTDVYFTDVNIIGFKTAIENMNGGNIFTRVHAWNKSNFANTTFVKTNGDAIYRDCCADTVALCYDIDGGVKTIIDGGIFVCNALWDSEMSDERWQLFKWTNNSASRYTKISNTYLSNGASKVPNFSNIEAKYVYCEFNGSNIFTILPINLPIASSSSIKVSDKLSSVIRNNIYKKNGRICIYLYCDANFEIGDNNIGSISVSFHRPSDTIKTIAYVDVTPVVITVNANGSIIANANEVLNGEFVLNCVFDTTQNT